MTRARDVANLIGSGNYSSTTFTATAGQTAFTISHTQGFIQVFMNGLLLDETVDYTSNGSAITLTSGAAAGDEIEVVKYNTFSVGDAVAASGGTFTGNVAMSGTLGVTGATTLTGNTTVGGTLGATGKITSTAGITFGSDTATENVLDDYEYGTWTPVLQGNTTAGTLTGSSGGRYTKLGQAVHIEFRINNVTLTGAAGPIKITGLPFRSTYGPQNSYAVCPIAFMYKFNFEHTRRQALYLGNNTTYLLGMESRANTTWTDWLITNNNAMYMNAQFTYITDQ